MQRSTPSLFRLRTGVRIPPPPAFARLRRASAGWTSWPASGIYLRRRLSRRSSARSARLAEADLTTSFSVQSALG